MAAVLRDAGVIVGFIIFYSRPRASTIVAEGNALGTNGKKFPCPERAGQNISILFLDCPYRANDFARTLTVGGAHGYSGPGFQPEIAR